MAEPGVSTVPCASGWCGKVIEGETGAFREDGKSLQRRFGDSLKTFLLRFRHGDTTDVRATRSRRLRGPLRQHHLQSQEGLYVLLPRRLVQRSARDSKRHHKSTFHIGCCARCASTAFNKNSINSSFEYYKQKFRFTFKMVA